MKDFNILKSFCQKIYFVGFGNFWYEEDVGDDRKMIYRIYNVLLFFIYGSMTVLEIFAALLGDFPKDEKGDCVTFAVSHTIVMIKMFSVIGNKELIRKLNYDMVSVCEEFEETSLQKKKYYNIKINVIAYFVAVYFSAACFVFEGLRKVKEGSHFVTIVTYYPSFEDDSIPATVFRIYCTIVLFMMMLTMIMSVDAFTMVNLIIFKYKIITLRRYFEKISEDFKEMHKINRRLAVENLATGLIKGFKVHKELLRILKDIDKGFGFVIALQLFQSSGSAVSLLLQIAISDDLTFVGKLKIMFFVIALFFLLGLFLCNAGEITYQSALLADSIFYCGWHECLWEYQLKGKKIGQMVLIACIQAQKPLVLKAFKMIELTYGTFLLVIKTTYSIFALFNAQSGNT
ncbi:odorant receptor 47b-like [Papilio machaon]|uniref:odorant receptor 47b-like n=1 Tax=Papilio machaon TaxID=76193 RepID=UPI001E665310|nr:odorant receptor 47b-like [Papilio machaon]